MEIRGRVIGVITRVPSVAIPAPMPSPAITSPG